MNKNFIFFAFFSLLYTITICGDPKPVAAKQTSSIPAISTDAMGVISKLYSPPASSGWALGFPTFFKGCASNLYTQAWRRLKVAWPWRFEELAKKNLEVTQQILDEINHHADANIQNQKTLLEKVQESLSRANEQHNRLQEEAKKEIQQANQNIGAANSLASENCKKIELAEEKNQKNKKKYKEQIDLFCMRFDRIRLLVQPNVHSNMHTVFTSFAKLKEERTEGSFMPSENNNHSQPESSFLD